MGAHCDQRIQQLQRQRTGTGAKFPDFIGTRRLKRLSQLPGQRLTKQRGQLRRGDEIAPVSGHLAELFARAGVVTQPWRVQRQGHEAVKRQPAALRRNVPRNMRLQALTGGLRALGAFRKRGVR